MRILTSLFCVLAMAACADDGGSRTGGGGGGGGRGGGGGGGGAAGPDDAALLDQFLDDYVAAACERMSTCGWFPADTAMCNDVMRFSAESVFFNMKRRLGTTLEFDPDVALECLDEVAAIACPGLDDDGVLRCMIPHEGSGSTILRGLVAVGGDCVDDLECESGKCGETCGTSSTRTCIATPTACSNDGDCIRYESCGPAGTCIADQTIATGQACTRERQCPADHYCDTTCEPFLAVGDPCSNSNQCPDLSYCDQGTSVCTLKPVEGEACAFNVPCRDGQSTYCDGTTNLCTARSDVGGPCSELESDSCRAMLSCECDVCIEGLFPGSF